MFNFHIPSLLKANSIWYPQLSSQLDRLDGHPVEQMLFFSFFFFQFANWISGRELTGLSQGDDEALTFLGRQNIRPPGKMTMGILRTGTPTPSSEGQQALGRARPWGCRGQAARKNTPGPMPGLRHALPLWAGSAVPPSDLYLVCIHCISLPRISISNRELAVSKNHQEGRWTTEQH